MFQQNGMLNGVIKSMGLAGQPFLGSMSQALGVLLSASLYLSVGYFMVIFVAGINEIPETYYEAARVDGATKVHQFWYITLPLVKPTSFFVLVMSILQGFQVFDQIYILTGGGPFYSTTTTVFYAFQNAFQYYQFGYASCITVFIFLVQMVFSIVLFRTLKGGEIQ
jgi:ABC-type sugar transport system permease subunit